MNAFWSRLALRSVPVTLAIVAAASLVVSYNRTDVRLRQEWISALLVNVASGLFTSLLVYVLVNLIHESAMAKLAAQIARDARISELLALARIDRDHALQSHSILRAMGALSDGSLRGRSVAGANFAGLSFDGADLREVDMSGCNLRGCTFIGANADRSRFEGADLSDAVLDFGSVDGAGFSGAVFDPEAPSGDHL